MEGRHSIVKRHCRGAALTGVCAGMPLELARAKAPAAEIMELDPMGDFKALYKLALWAYRYSPICALDRELVRAYRAGTLSETDPRWCGITLDLEGTERLHKSFEELAVTLLTELEHAGFEARIAVAPTIGSAWALSRYGTRNPVVLGSRSIASALSDIPLEALRIPASITEELARLGIHTLAHLKNLPRDALSARFDPSALTRVDQALGTAGETLCTIQPRVRLRVIRRFEIPLGSTQALTRAVLEAFKELGVKLSAAKRTATRYLLALRGLDPYCVPFGIEREIHLQVAAYKLVQLQNVLAPVLESIRFKGGIHRLVVSAGETSEGLAEQHSYLGDEPDPLHREQRAELLNTMSARLGPPHIRRAVLHDSHIPERTYSYASLESGALDDGLTLPCHAPELERPNLPPYFFEEPERIDAMALLPDRPPSWIKWRKERLRIVSGSEAERIGTEWWHARVSRDVGQRDYFKVQDDRGRWLWVFCERSSMQWFVQGIWA